MTNGTGQTSIKMPPGAKTSDAPGQRGEQFNMITVSKGSSDYSLKG